MCEAQKITLGSCETKDGGFYQGEMVSGKPHGKGRTEYKNGDTYEGSYVKVRGKGMEFIHFLMVKNTMVNGSKISNMAVARTIL